MHEAMVTCFQVDKHYDHEVRFHLVTAQDGEVVVTKRPKDTMYMPTVLDDDPELYVIYLLRDPRDTICSRHGKNREIYYSNIRLWRQMHGYAAQMYGHKRFLQIRYEDLVNDPNQVQREVMEQVPWLVKKYNFSDYHLHAHVSEKSQTAMNSVRPIAPTSVAVWKSNLGRIVAQQLTHGSLTPDLIACGYETDEEWENVLQGISPDKTRSLYPEKLSSWRRISQSLDARRKVAKYRRNRGISP